MARRPGHEAVQTGGRDQLVAGTQIEVIGLQRTMPGAQVASARSRCESPFHRGLRARRGMKTGVSTQP